LDDVMLVKSTYISL